MLLSKQRKAPLWLLAFLPLFVGIAVWVTYPFADTLCSKTFSLADLSAVQKSNIELAARSINGTVLKPGEAFSFNSVVGPRTERRGYRPAPSYLGPENAATLGGGICLVSSALYQLALESGLQIDQRVAHLRTIKTVPAGLDATVWYGQADLRLKNTFGCPVQLTTDWNRDTLTVSLLGRKPANYTHARIDRIVSRATPTEMVVELLRRQGTQVMLISRDHYSVAN